MAPSDTSPTTDAVRDQLDDAKEVDGRATKEKQDEEFRENQRAAAAAQNLTAENAVPEQRPIASQQTIPEIHQSETFRRLKEEGELDSEPMPREAYEKAASEEQAKKAAKASQTERLIDGTRVLVLKTPYDERPTYGHILRTEFASFEEEAKASSGNPALSRFAEVETYVVKIRGGRPDTVSCTPDEVRQVSEADFGRSVV